jgi:hypothetical protein
MQSAACMAVIDPLNESGAIAILNILNLSSVCCQQRGPVELQTKRTASICVEKK